VLATRWYFDSLTVILTRDRYLSPRHENVARISPRASWPLSRDSYVNNTRNLFFFYYLYRYVKNPKGVFRWIECEDSFATFANNYACSETCV
jgi:hypothetical protein